MRILLVAAACILSLNASAQFWRSKPKPRWPALSQVSTFSIADTVIKRLPIKIAVQQRPFNPAYNFDLVERAIMKEAKHNMHYGVYALAGDNFSELARWYLLKNRFSEAKWYLLQSIALSRSLNDAPHTVNYLLALADIKLAIGENTLAKGDMLEARTIARKSDMQASIADIDKRMTQLLAAKTLAAKPTLRYSEEVEAASRRGELR